MARLATLVLLGVAALAGCAGRIRVRAPDPAPDPLPSPRWGASAAALNGRLYVFGGVHGRWLDDVLSLDPKTGRWSAIGTMSLPRLAAATAVVDGKILLSGGSVFVRNGVTANDLQIFDPRARSWRSGPPMIFPRQSHDLFRLNGKLFAFGGMGGLGSFEVLSHGRWSEAGRTPRAYFSRCSAAVGGKAYFVGGVDAIPGANHRRTELDVYDPAANAWNSLKPMPEPRESCAAAAIDGKIFVVGGDGEDHKPLASVSIYDPASDAWSHGTPLPLPLRNSAAAVVDGRLYVVGGSDSPVGNFGLSVVVVYDPATGAWTLSRGSDAPIERPRPY